MKDQLLKGTMILTIAGFATRVIGFCYRIFLAGELGEVNLGIYQLIFPVYSICFTIYAAGIQTAVSQLISHQPQKNHGQIIKAGITLSLCLAVLLSFSLFSFRTVIAHSFLGADKTAPLLFVLAFIFPFCGVTSTINGYFYGKNNAKIPAVTQIIEQLVRVVFVVSFCFYDLLPVSSLILSVAGLVIGELASNFYNMYHLIKECSLIHLFRQKAQFGNVIRMALPLTGTKLIIALLGSVESVFIPPILCKAGASLEDALAIYGILTGVVLPFILFPGTITNSLSVLLLPAISRASGKKDNHHVRQTTSVTVRYSLLLGVLTCAVFLNYGMDLGQFVFHSENAGKLLTLLAFLCPFLYVTTTLGSIINGLGKTVITFAFTVIGLIIRIGCLFFLAPVYGIFGYLFGLLCSQIVICLCHGVYLMKKTQITIHVTKYFVWPFVFLVSLLYISKIFCRYLIHLTNQSYLAYLSLIPVFLAAFFYFYQCGLISKKDIKLFR